MNILLYTNLFPSMKEPTRGVFNLHGFEPLARSHRVRVVAPVGWWRRLRDPGSLFSTPCEQRGGLDACYPTVWGIPRARAHRHASMMYRSTRGLVMQMHAEAPFDGVIGSFAYPDAVAAARLAAELEVPLIALVLGSDINALAQRRSLAPQIRAALRQAELVVALTQPLKQRVIELGVDPAKVVVQHNGVDGDRFNIRDRQQARERLGQERSAPLVCYVGNLVPEKGPDVLLRAFARLRNIMPGVRLVFVGDGNLRTSLGRDAQRMGIASSVKFAGRQRPEEIPWWIAACDVLCLPSRREGCPNVVLEAHASGRPVVASAVGGVPELVSDRNGMMVPPDEPAQLAEALHTTLTRLWNPAEIRGALHSLSWDDFAAVFSSAFASLSRAKALPGSPS